MRRSFNAYADMLITLMVTLNIVYPFAFHAKDFTGLSSGRDFHFYFAVERRHVDFLQIFCEVCFGERE